MNDQDLVRSAEALDTALDATINDNTNDHNNQARPSNSDPVLKAIVAIEQAITPTASMQANVWQKVLIAHHQASHTTRVPQRGQWRKYRLLSVAAAAALILIVAAIWSNGTKPANAAQILAQAVRVSSDPTGAGLQSYRGVVVGENHSYRPETGLNSRATKWKAFFWFQAPNLARSEYYLDCLCIVRPNRQPFTGLVTPLTTGDPDTDLSSLSGSDGTSNWFYDVKSNTGTWADIGNESNFEEIVDLQSLLAIVGEDSASVKLVGSETLLGLAVYVLDVKIKPQGGRFYPFTRKRLKIDQQNFIVLAEEDLDDKGQTYFKWQMMSLDLNVTIDPSLFTFTVPPTAVMTDWRTTDDPVELLRAWQTAAEKVEFPLYQLTDVPAGMKLTRASRNVDAGVRGTYGNIAVEQRVIAKDGTDAVVIIEGGHTIVMGSEEKIAVGPYTGYYQELNGQDQVRLRVDMGTTQVNFMAWPAEISKAELIKMAASLVKVVP